jgi:hypothetical protein
VRRCPLDSTQGRDVLNHATGANRVPRTRFAKGSAPKAGLEVLEEAPLGSDGILVEVPARLQILEGAQLPQIAPAPLTHGIAAAEPCQKAEALAEAGGAPDVDGLAVVDPLRLEPVDGNRRVLAL